MALNANMAGKQQKGGSMGAGGMQDIIGGGMSMFGTGMDMFSDINMSTSERMDDRGMVTHDVDWAGNVVGMAAAGGQIGSVAGPYGFLIGTAAGALIGAGGSLLDENNQPDGDDVIAQGNKFDLSNRMKTIGGENTFIEQAEWWGKDGMNVKGETKQIEVEKDELVLRKTGKAFRKVADFRGGKPHEMGGEQYVASKGDIIIPGKHRAKVNRMLKNRRWSAIESVRQSLPTDIGQPAANGMVVDPPVKDTIPTTELNKYLKKKDSLGYGKSIDPGFLIDSPNGGDIDPGFLMESPSGDSIDPGFRMSPAMQEKMRTKSTQYKKGTKSVSAGMYEEGTSGIRGDGDKLLTYEEAYKLAEEAGSKFPGIVAAQFALETDWGRKQANAENNLFNIKWNKAAAAKLKAKGINVTKAKAPATDNQTGTSDYYMEFDSIEDSFKGYQNFIETNPRYKKALAADSAEEYIQELKKAGYAEDPNYVDSILNIAKSITTDATSSVSFTGPVNPADRTIGSMNTERDEARVKAADDQNKLYQEEKAFVTRGTPTGKARSDEKKETVDDWLIGSNVTAPSIHPRIKQELAGFVNTQIRRVTKSGENQEVFFQDSPEGESAKKQAYALHDFIEGKASILGDIGGELGATFAVLDAGITGQEIEGQIPFVDSNMISGFTREEWTGYMNEAKEAGIITDEYGEMYANSLYDKPEDLYTTQMGNQFAFDIATIVANPMGAVSAIRGLGKLTKGAYKGVKALPGIKRLAKNAPAVAKKLYKGIAADLKSTTTFQKGDSMDGIYGIMDDITENAAKGTIPDEVVKEAEAVRSTWQKATDYISKLPAKARKGFYGKNIDEIKAAEKQISEITGKSSAEIMKMSPDDIGKMYTKGITDKLDKIKDLTETKAANWTRYNKIKGRDEALKGELEALRKGKADPVEIGKIEKKIAEVEKEAQSAVQAITESKNAEAVAYKEIDRLEGFMSDPLYRDKFRTIMQLNEGVKNQTKALTGADEATQALIRSENELYRSLESLESAKGTVRSKALSDVTSAVETSAKNRGAALKETQSAAAKAQNAIGAEKARMKSYKKMYEEFPELHSALEKDKILRGRFLDGSITQLAAIDALLGTQGDNPEDALVAERQAIADQEQAEKDSQGAIPGETTPGVTPRPKATAIEVPAAKGIQAEKDPDLAPIVAESEIPAGEDQPMVGSGLEKAVGALEEVAAYAPALYNIVKGAEKPAKVPRRFVTPQTREYHNMAQPQMNAIDMAFNASLANNRNLSGGMMGNYRSNVEASWAKKIDAQNKVHVGETMRADKIANDNITTMNQADQINTQANAKYDVMDMQSEAATKAFMAQGMQDIANISSVKRKDRNAESNQNMILKMIGSKNFDMGGFIEDTPTEEAPAEYVAPPVPVDTDMFEDAEDMWGIKPLN